MYTTELGQSPLLTLSLTTPPILYAPTYPRNLNWYRKSTKDTACRNIVIKFHVLEVLSIFGPRASTEATGALRTVLKMFEANIRGRFEQK